MALRLTEQALEALLAKQRCGGTLQTKKMVGRVVEPEKSLYEILALGQLKCEKSPCVVALNQGLKLIANPATRSKPFERVEQAASLVWLEYTYPEAFEMTTTNPMGGFRPTGAGGQIKGEGAKKGYPDVICDFPRMGYHGLRIEMKQYNETANPTEEQLRWLTKLAHHGYKSVLCRGHQAAIFTFCEYFDIPKPHFTLPKWSIVSY